jgi:membrane protease YdiL (CAAX protease family)
MKLNDPASGFPLRAALPGIAVVIVFALFSSALPGKVPHEISIAYLILLTIMPWLAILVKGQGPAPLGFTSRKVSTNLIWGVLLGILWRGSTLLLNFALIHILPLQAKHWTGFETIFLMPWMEEVFFRGYLGSALSTRLGRNWGNFLQAGLFTLQPAHTSQGIPAVIQIYLFGLAAGWVVQRNGSIWAAVAAHAVANAMVVLLSIWI